VKVHVTGAIVAPPVVAFAPDTVTVYVVLGASWALGVKVATVPPLRASVPDTEPEAPTSWMTVVPVVTDRSKVTETLVVSGRLVAFAAGDCAVISGGPTVENDHASGVIDAPAALVAPDAATLYVLPWAHWADGVKVAVFVPELYVVEPPTGLPPASVTVNVVPVTAWLKPSATVAFWATFAAFVAGVCDVTVGRAAVVKFHDTGVIGVLPGAVAPETVTEYVVDGARSASGVKVAVVAGPLSVTVPVTGVPPVATWMLVVPATTARSKPAETVVASETFVAFEAGVRVETLGEVVVVVNDHVTGTIVPPAALFPPATVTL
jgi:hypothetical protein